MKTDTKESIDRYIQVGLPLGDFLTAVVCGHLFSAAVRADEENARDLCEIALYVRNKAPWASIGSLEIYKAWCGIGGLEGFRSQ